MTPPPGPSSRENNRPGRHPGQPPRGRALSPAGGERPPRLMAGPPPADKVQGMDVSGRTKDESRTALFLLPPSSFGRDGDAASDRDLQGSGAEQLLLPQADRPARPPPGAAAAAAGGGRVPRPGVRAARHRPGADRHPGPLAAAEHPLV